MPQGIYLAERYRRLWQAVLDGVPDVPYKQGLVGFLEKYYEDNLMRGSFRNIIFPKFTDDEREAWLEAYLDLLEKTI
jgi:hypothetical protein